MSTIKQLIAELQLAPELDTRQKVVIKKLIEEAEARIAAKAPRAPRKITNAKSLVTLDEWERARGKELHYTDLTDWIARHALDEFQVRLMIEEFRGDMAAKGKQYANFVACFQTYLRKGFLTKTIDACAIAQNGGTVVHNRGGAM